jgi:hypothetical protein
MASYEFRYANHSGAPIRTTVMQCEADEEAIRKARETMQDRYVTLEIFDGDRPVFRARED